MRRTDEQTDRQIPDDNYYRAHAQRRAVTKTQSSSPTRHSIGHFGDGVVVIVVVVVVVVVVVTTAEGIGYKSTTCS